MKTTKAAMGHTDAVTRIRNLISGSGRGADAAAEAQAGRVAGDATAQAEAKLGQLEELRQTASTARQAADAVRVKGGPAYGAYRTADAIARLGGQGAGLPFKPYEMALKGLGKAGKWIAEIPTVSEKFARFDEYVGMSRALMNKGLRDRMASLQSEVQGKAGGRVGKLTRAFKAMDS